MSSAVDMCRVEIVRLLNQNTSLQKQLSDKTSECEKLNCRIEEMLTYIPKLGDTSEVRKLRKEVEEFHSGKRGACSTCEPVGELNIKFENGIKELMEATYQLNTGKELTVFDVRDKCSELLSELYKNRDMF